MPPNLIALAVPLFFLAIGVELWAARLRGVKVYRLVDAVADMSCGVSQQVVQLFYALALVSLYGAVHQRWTLIRFPEGSLWPWVISAVGVDLAYYWWHRLSHRLNFLWAAHVVHHQSEDYNLAVALRQSMITSFTLFPLMLPLAFLGVPPLHFAAMSALNTLYQFWIHTQLIGKLGVVDRWLSTPSLHRVHHAINPRYIDKNYGGFLILWDRLFGTYEPETEPPVYGLVAPLRSFNPLWAQVAYWVELFRRARRATRFSDRLRVFWKGPEWHLPGVETPHLPAPVSPSTYVKYEVAPSRALRAYVFAHFVAMLVGTFCLMMWGRSWPISARVIAAVAILGSMPVWSGLLEGHRWAARVEPIRLALLVAGAAAALTQDGYAFVAPPLLMIAITSAAVLLAVKPLRGGAPAKQVQ